jgi:esterase/lipase/1-acyl-sn-glycerol-3-phosphate acyltransferase
MTVSNALIKTLEITLDFVFKGSGTDIRLHGIERIPDQPVLYVINHFTRLETILMPYIIKKHIKKYAISLADKSFFDGRLGDFLNKMGAISTDNPERDTLMINALLTGSYPLIIYPEGQMIKDKKIIEKGKYLVYNAGSRRPPHTAAGRIALRSQFIREELRMLRDKGDDESISRMAAHFGFSPGNVPDILQKETVIVPVNITYYPVRARDNAINRLVNRFIRDVSIRLEEELEVEGSMLMEGVDIDINFGDPLPMKHYMTVSGGVQQMLADENLYLKPGELKYVPPFKKLYITIMYDYMQAIYGMTTVNIDHLASYILTKYRKNVISEDDFKNRIFLAIEHLLNSGITNYHTTLGLQQFYLITDDFHNKYGDFIKTALEKNLIELTDFVITRNDELFSRNYQFHTIRKDNIIEVLKNEIEPLENLTEVLDRLMITPDAFIRKKIRNRILEFDRRLFVQDYDRYYAEGESKPRSIGEPFFLRHPLGKKGVILVHGYMAAPEEIRPLAEYLYKTGYSVYGVRLRGHGTSPEDLALREWNDWYNSVGRAYIVIKNSVKHFAIAGFSMGAGLALLQAANKPRRFKGIISINGPARLQDTSSRFSSLAVARNTFFSAIHVNAGKMEYVDNDPENPHINYLRNPVHGVYELGKLMKLVMERLGSVMEPVLIIQGSDDPVVNPVSGREIFKKLGSKKKQLIKINADHHGILRGKEAEMVKENVLTFLKDAFSE